MRDYELVVLYHPDLEIDLDKALKKIEDLIKKSKGKITFSESWGKRKLAYPIQKQEYAIYVYYEIQLPLEGISAIESQLNITDEVIRYLLTKPTPNFGDREKKMLAADSEDAGGVDNKEEAEEKKAPAKKKIASKADEKEK